MAERLASAAKRVLVVDRNAFVGGTAYDRIDEDGVLVHVHGAHLFHTNSPHVVEYLSRFAEWRPYEHRVLARVSAPVGTRLVPMPINRTTVNRLFDLDLQTEAEVERFFEAEREPPPPGGIKTSEDQVVARVGRRLYDLLYRDYTRKHWGVDASQLHASVAGRLPFRTGLDDRYFTDAFQAMPVGGFTALITKMLVGPNIDLQLGTEWSQVEHRVGAPLTVFTGPIDEFFAYELGGLPFRSVQFRRTHYPTAPDLVQATGVINWPGLDAAFTRTIEHRHFTGQDHVGSTVHTEYPGDSGDPHYPIPSEENWALLRRYRALAVRERPDVVFLGRLGRYQYMTMDQTVAQALRAFERLRL